MAETLSNSTEPSEDTTEKREKPEDDLLLETLAAGLEGLRLLDGLGEVPEDETEE